MLLMTIKCATTLYKTRTKGDWVYAPARCGATRVIGEEPIVAAFGFFFDHAHKKRLLRDFATSTWRR